MIGRQIAHFTVVEKLGEGGMGVVYKARDAHLDRFVALKALPPEKTADPERKRRFVQEAKAASALNHPNIVHIYDIFSADGGDFIAMEYVSGRTLGELIGRKGMKPGDALGYAIQVADALAKAHSAGIVHRDLKPPNIMVNDDGVVKILDFGLAKLAEPAAAQAGTGEVTLETAQKPITEHGIIVGTVAYMSPEQAQGQPVDARSDIFSFGCVLYEMLSGRQAFQGDSKAAVLAAVLREEPKPLDETVQALPLELGRAVTRCLRKDPRRRWQSMSDLRVVLQDSKEESESGKLAARAAGAPVRRFSWKIWLAVTSAIVALAAGLWFFLPRAPEKPAEPAIKRLTYDSGVTRFPAISPDGKLAAYASDRSGDGNLDIYVQQISGREAVRLTHHEADDLQPSFSPDGSKIVFRSERDGSGVYLIDALGGQERRVADRGWHPQFSPDGSRILYAEAGSWASAVMTPSRMYLVSAQGGAPVPFQPDFRVLPYTGTGPVPVWSPDGEHVLFSGMRGTDASTRDWWVAPVDGGPAVPTGAAKDLLTGAPTALMAWFRNRVIFGRGISVAGFNLWAVEISPRDWTTRGEPERITSGPGIQIDPSVSADGRLLFVEMSTVTSIWSLKVDPTRGTALGEPRELIGDQRVKTQPSISRDGSRLAYGAYISVGSSQLHLRDMASGREMSFVSPGRGSLLYPQLSADGSLLAYRDVVDNKLRSFLVAGDSSASRQICEECTVRGFFSDKNAALVQYGDELFRQELSSGTRIPLLTLSSGRIRDASLSPDDRRMAVLTDRPDAGNIIFTAPVRSAPVPEQDWIVAASDSSYLDSPRWSADGRLLYFVSERDGHSCIWAQRLEPAGMKPVGEAFAVRHEHRARYFLNLPRGYGVISVARNTLVYMLGEQTGNIWMTDLRFK